MRATIFVNLTAALTLSTASLSVAADVVEPTIKPERRVVLVSNAARAVITEAKIDGNFSFERCYLPNSPTKTVTQELADEDYSSCVSITSQIADNQANRVAFGHQFQYSIDRMFEKYSRFHTLGRTAMYATLVGSFAALLPLFKIPKLGFLYGQSLGRMAAVGAAAGSVVALGHGFYAMDHMDDYGLGRETEDALISDDLSSDLIYLDRSAPKPKAARQALAVFEHALSEATTATLATSLN